MAKSNNDLDYQSIRSLKDLKYQRKLLSSRLDNQEIMIMYQVRTIRDYYSIFNVAYMGFESLAARNSKVAVAFRAFNAAKALIHKIRG